MFLIYPFFEGGGMGTAILTIIFTAILLTGVYAACQRKLHLIIGLCLAVPSIIIDWLHIITKNPDLYLPSGIMSMLFYIFVIGIILHHIITAKEVTADIIFGAINVYLLIGLTWGVLYSILYIFRAQSFIIDPAHITGAGINWSVFVYFSFTTLTTLGYGDITPAGSFAQSLASLEAVVGVLYIGIMVARLVGLYLYQEHKKAS